jgi:hypothetical protein
VCVTISRDTADLAVDAIQDWWGLNQAHYPQAKRLMIEADSGGSNGGRSRRYKKRLQEFADLSGLELTVCHYPPGTSKWNQIEHRLFSLVAFGIVDSIGCRTACRLSWKVVVVDLVRCLTPRLTGVFELTDKFLFLGVHADAWIAATAESLALLVNMPELPIALGMLLARVQHFAVATQPVLLVTQQTADRQRHRPGTLCGT